jgi:hypothetical protein
MFVAVTKASLLIGNVVNFQFSILKQRFFTKQRLTESAVHQQTACQIMLLVSSFRCAILILFMTHSITRFFFPPSVWFFSPPHPVFFSSVVTLLACIQHVPGSNLNQDGTSC